MSYSRLPGASQGVDETYKHTLARIQKIQSHLDNAPRGSRLKGKVCIITGVGSLKGIGYVRTRWYYSNTVLIPLIVVLRPSSSPTKVFQVARDPVVDTLTRFGQALSTYTSLILMERTFQTLRKRSRRSTRMSR
jgi:hypothetical protein